MLPGELASSCPRPECYRSCGSSTPDEFPTDIPGTKGNFKLVRHVSFVDCPGHDILMAIVLNGAAVMDAEHNDLRYAAPGGLIGVGTETGPTLRRGDRMVGQVLGAVGALPEIFTELEISYFRLRQLLGARTEGDKKAAKVQKLPKNEVLMVNIGSLSTGGRVSAVTADLGKIVLTNPVCTEVGEKIALSRRVEKHWRLIGWGQIRRGVTVKPTVGDD
ncbi:hypothetical protein EI555_007021 [Monodon monoceros]|uniref:Initiation factor eIF2 gamma C-terminal domain-containing protein n=1 Tax=Monodon monoceros TaxID=40151 RepID=A0A4U1FBQ5_MONMO|nr:hypothetical protein EI555_007021 [Monodon monoceros]